MRAVNDPPVLTQDLPLSGDDDPFRVNPQTDRAVGEGRRHTVAVALEVHEAGRRYALGVFYEAVEGAPHRHQAGNFTGVYISDRTRKSPMLDLLPLRDALLLKPGVQGIQIRKAR